MLHWFKWKNQTQGYETLGSKTTKLSQVNYFLIFVINRICCKESKEASVAETDSRKISEDSR